RYAPLYTSCFSPLTPPSPSTLFPYTTLFRSADQGRRLWSKEALQPDGCHVGLANHGHLAGQDILALVGPALQNTQDADPFFGRRSEEHTSELQSPCNLVCRLLLEKKN